MLRVPIFVRCKMGQLLPGTCTSGNRGKRPCYRSHVSRGNADPDALRPGREVGTPHGPFSGSHAKHGNHLNFFPLLLDPSGWIAPSNSVCYRSHVSRGNADSDALRPGREVGTPRGPFSGSHAKHGNHLNFFPLLLDPIGNREKRPRGRRESWGARRSV